MGKVIRPFVDGGIRYMVGSEYTGDALKWLEDGGFVEKAPDKKPAVRKAPTKASKA